VDAAWLRAAADYLDRARGAPSDAPPADPTRKEV
jgi:hypothetical protein